MGNSDVNVQVVSILASNSDEIFWGRLVCPSEVTIAVLGDFVR